VPGFLSCRPNWVSPPSPPAWEFCSSPLRVQGRGWRGEPNSDEGTYALVLYVYCNPSTGAIDAGGGRGWIIYPPLHIRCIFGMGGREGGCIGCVRRGKWNALAAISPSAFCIPISFLSSPRMLYLSSTQSSNCPSLDLLPFIPGILSSPGASACPLIGVHDRVDPLPVVSLDPRPLLPWILYLSSHWNHDLSSPKSSTSPPLDTYLSSHLILYVLSFEPSPCSPLDPLRVLPWILYVPFP
jgi:hypothetical protein